MRGMALAFLVAASTALSLESLEPLEGEPPTLSRFDRTIRYLQDSPPEERAGFAVAALTELTAVYMAEAGLARSEASDLQGESPAKLLGWSLAVDQYASQLLLVLDDVWDVAHAGPLDVIGAPGALLITTRNRQVLTGLSARDCSLDVLGLPAALQLLADWVGRSVADLPASAAQVSPSAGTGR